MEFAFAFGAVGLPFAGERIALDVRDVLQVNLHPINRRRTDDVDVLGGLAAEVQSRLGVGVAAHQGGVACVVVANGAGMEVTKEGEIHRDALGGVLASDLLTDFWVLAPI